MPNNFILGGNNIMRSLFASTGRGLEELLKSELEQLGAQACQITQGGVGPVIANYGLESLRFIEPVKPGDTIQVRLTCKRKTLKKQRSAEEKPTGVVEWAVEVFNQHQTPVALYSILTLVARQHGDFVD